MSLANFLIDYLSSCFLHLVPFCLACYINKYLILLKFGYCTNIMGGMETLSTLNWLLLHSVSRLQPGRHGLGQCLLSYMQGCSLYTRIGELIIIYIIMESGSECWCVLLISYRMYSTLSWTEKGLTLTTGRGTTTALA